MQTTPSLDAQIGGAVASEADPSAHFLAVLPAASHLQPARRRAAVAVEKKKEPETDESKRKGPTLQLLFNDVGWLSSGLLLVWSASLRRKKKTKKTPSRCVETHFGLSTH